MAEVEGDHDRVVVDDPTVQIPSFRAQQEMPVGFLLEVAAVLERKVSIFIAPVDGDVPAAIG